ncbi:MAG: hypothetical protein NC433_07000 [Clostridiales bacterium]|nr:hypothetical protein [Clostridiales bacterium]
MKNYIENYLILEKIGKSPSECLFVDNSVKNLEVADDLGIQTILYNRDNVDYDGIIINSFVELSGKLDL